MFIVEDFDKNTPLNLQKEEIEKAQWVNSNEIAQYSNNKGSYVNIQRLLVEEIRNENYIEVL